MATRSNGNGKAAPAAVRCAIYTRKSTDEGLNQDFNSLDAQRDAGEAYIRSQAGEGWTLLPAQYDDGGFTGANMDRPALRRLLADVQARKVDCIVVYKVDRLSRSIRDFGKIMEVLEKHGAMFVSVTQQFNTTSSLGRLTLNILLSFAQFEREIISERTRDKQVLARKRGKWTGGHLPLGYDLEDGSLVVNEEEARRVRQIFERYLEGHSVHGIVAKCEDQCWRNKEWATREGRSFGGHPLRKCHLYTILANPLYAARIRAADDLVAAAHARIIDDETFDLVQQKLKENTRNSGGERRPRLGALLRGLLYCSCCGSAMSPSYSSSKSRRYRYYVCLRAAQRAGLSKKAAAAADVDHPRVPRVARLMALAIKLQDMIDRGEIADYAEIARLGLVTRARVTQIMNLLLLAPDIQEELLSQTVESTEESRVFERALREVGCFVDWQEQWKRWTARYRSTRRSTPASQG